MKSLIKKQIREANTLLREFISGAREALSGRRAFSPDSLRAVAAPLERMAPIVSQADELRAADVSLTPEFKEYADSLSALQNTLEQVRFMLLARQNSLQASRSHAETVNLWATRFNQTR